MTDIVVIEALSEAQKALAEGIRSGNAAALNCAQSLITDAITAINAQAEKAVDTGDQNPA